MKNWRKHYLCKCIYWKRLSKSLAIIFLPKGYLFSELYHYSQVNIRISNQSHRIIINSKIQKIFKLHILYFWRRAQVPLVSACVTQTLEWEQVSRKNMTNVSDKALLGFKPIQTNLCIWSPIFCISILNFVYTKEHYLCQWYNTDVLAFFVRVSTALLYYLFTKVTWLLVWMVHVQNNVYLCHL